MAHDTTTRSPGVTDDTPGPISSTMPAPSWPSSIGNGVLPQLPFSIAHRSE
jgi:hypothetical protein